MASPAIQAIRALKSPFVPQKPEIVSIGRTSVSLYKKVDESMSDPKKALAFQHNRTALAGADLDQHARILTLADRLNLMPQLRLVSPTGNASSLRTGQTSGTLRSSPGTMKKGLESPRLRLTVSCWCFCRSKMEALQTVALPASNLSASNSSWILPTSRLPRLPIFHRTSSCAGSITSNFHRARVTCQLQRRELQAHVMVWPGQPPHNVLFRHPA
jgi:hypothetical protein